MYERRNRLPSPLPPGKLWFGVVFADGFVSV